MNRDFIVSILTLLILATRQHTRFLVTRSEKSDSVAFSLDKLKIEDKPYVPHYSWNMLDVGSQIGDTTL